MANSTSFENSIRIVRTNRTIEVSKSFDKAASRFGTREYEAMQQVRKDYPDFTIVVKTVRTKADHFKGLTVSAQQSTAYKNVRRYEILSQKLEKLQVSFSRKREETG